MLVPRGNPGGHRAGAEDRGLGLGLCHHHILGSELRISKPAGVPGEGGQRRPEGWAEDAATEVQGWLLVLQRVLPQLKVVHGNPSGITSSA